MSDFGALSLVPPLLAILLAIVTRKAVLSLFLGVWVGGVIYSGGLGVGQTFTWIASALGDSVFHAQVVIFLLLLGSAVAMIWRIGGSHAVRDWTMNHLDSQRKAGVVAWLLGIAMFFDDYANTAIVGSSVKDVSDRLKISREKLSYIVDSTAAPVSTLGISSWVAYQLTMIEEGYAATDLAASEIPDAFEVFLQSIPFNMYAILAIVMVGIVVLSGRDYGEMLGAEHRAATTGLVSREGARPMQDVAAELGEPDVTNPRLRSFFLPIAVLIVVTLGSGLYTGYQPGATLQEMFTGGDYAMALIFGSFAMVVSTYLLAWFDGHLTLGESVDVTIDGFSLMLTAVTILVLAWSIGNVANDLGTGKYVAGIATQTLSPAVLPAVVLFVTGFVAFSMGSAWAAMSIMTPIVIPVAWELAGTHTMVAVVVGMVFSGAIFGDHTSPISDTTVLSATFTGADLIDHVRTQLYYAITVAVVTASLMVVWGVTRISPVILLVVGVVVLTGLVYALSALDARRRSIDPVQTPVESAED
ncbi:Na+/H+ antiporter NhaC family protein [Halodesulfurarchaeum sp. HSR-GB]|uniref:Na+/H+ antiporter NhaC family protein n=1 Tax=Halodesulfurarchaeum sp. HSR-GB TaxID=3074077 RepID=UPI0028598792|nr:Na+/H+ antiporter NhaC family protein [Halodesulfurarchaeum sp. HSR-GB]MDR5656131.1 Na+/H+ antiporter NhaC family protein [Halodesulfurarchaeum sp. HSR-GB]